MLFLHYSKTTLQANCYILADDTQRVALVVDPGAKSAPWVADMVKKYNLTLGAILLTHAHLDHCWDASAIAGSTPVYVSVPDFYRLDDPAHHTGFSPSPFERESGHAWERPERTLEIPPALFVGGGAELVPGIALRAVPMPGHTEGSTIFLFAGDITASEETPSIPDTRRSNQYLLTGDVLFAGSIGRTDLPGGSDSEMVQSLRTLSQIIAPHTAFFPGHGKPSTIENEMETNPYLRHACGKAM